MGHVMSPSRGEQLEQKWVTIADPEAFRRVLEGIVAVNAKAGRPKRHLAEVFGITLRHFYRLLQPSIGQKLTQPVFSHISALADGRLGEELRRATITAGEEQLIRYERWLTRANNLDEDRVDCRTLVLTEVAIADDECKTMLEEFRSQLTKEGWDAGATKTVTRSSGSSYRTWGPTNPRVELALYRIVEPLVECRIAGPVERSTGELSPAELRSFIRAGIQRELILMRREQSLARLTPAALDRFEQSQVLRAEHASRGRRKK